jgi:endoglucanase
MTGNLLLTRRRLVIAGVGPVATRPSSEEFPPSEQRSEMRRRAALLTAAALAVATPFGAWAVTSSQAGGCTVAYKVGAQWPGGFIGDITVTNEAATVNDWTLTFSFPTSTQKVLQGWHGIYTQAGSAVTVSNASWNGTVASNGSVRLGFVGVHPGTNNPEPTSFSFNGVTCNGPAPAPAPDPDPTDPSTPTTSPTVSPTPTSTTAAPVPTTLVPTTSVPTTSSTTQPATSGSAPALKVSGNKLVTTSGETYRLLGVNRSGGEFACIQGNGIWDGPMDAASIEAMRTWKVRAVRVPLNEECWLGTGNVQAEYGGTNYQAEVKTYVNLLISKGITPILEMHWNYGQYTGSSSGCSETKASCQKPMPDAEYAPTFWTSVAQTFKGNDAVILDLFNEPYPERATGDAASGWTCWRDGGTCNGIGYEVAGFQSLVDAVRGTGATNVVMIGGLAYSNDVSQWLDYKPKDPLNNLMAFAHVYNFNTCSDTSCYDSTFAKVAAQVPFALTEIGENDCAHSFVDTLMDWADTSGIGYLGWTWNTWNCGTGPALISDYDGTPTSFGQGIKDHLAKVSN